MTTITHGGSLIRLLVVEDDEDFRGTICRYLERFGMAVTALTSVEEMETFLLAGNEADIVVLDVNLPGESGMSAAGRLRRHSRLGIILLTARCHIDDRVLGLSVGADAYLAKPVDPRELVATIGAVHRRLAGPAPGTQPLPPDEGWSFDPARWCLISPGGLPIPLSTAEYRFVALLTTTPGTPVTRDQILVTLGKLASEEDRSIDTMLSRLKQKVRKTCDQDLPIRAVRGLGYVFATQVREP